MIDCLEYAINKENEIPRLIKKILDDFDNKSIGTFNSKMRSAQEILSDYGLGGE